jgi:hypothetical protein
MALEEPPTAMKDEYLLYAFEQFAMEATKGRTFGDWIWSMEEGMKEAKQLLVDLRDLLRPVMNVDVQFHFGLGQNMNEIVTVFSKKL